MYGISVYLADLAAAEQICAEAHDQGFDRLFTSLHIPEDDPSALPRLLRRLASIARRNQLALIADISGRTLQALGLDASSVGELRGWGVYGLRIDFGIDRARIVAMSRSLPVYLNASTVNEHDLDELVDAGVNTAAVEAIHNFYPKPHTGLSPETLRRRNRMLHERGIPVAGFVPGDGTKRPPLAQGLPTLEQHRRTHPLAAAIELTALDTDHVYIGDQTLQDRTSAQWRRYVRDHTIDLALTVAAGCVTGPVGSRLGHPDRNRPDPGRDLIRLQGSRPALDGIPIPPLNTATRPAGTVIVDNDLAGRYCGEIAITTTDLPPDPTVNVIGQIADRDLPLLAVIGADQAVAFSIAG